MKAIRKAHEVDFWVWKKEWSKRQAAVELDKFLHEINARLDILVPFGEPRYLYIKNHCYVFPDEVVVYDEGHIYKYIQDDVDSKAFVERYSIGKQGIPSKYAIYFLDGGNAYYHPNMCLRFKTLEEAELEAMNIIKQETYVNIPGNVNKVFIEIMVVDEEKEQEYADPIFVDTMFNKAKEEAHKDYKEMKNEKLKKQAKIVKWFREH